MPFNAPDCTEVATAASSVFFSGFSQPETSAAEQDLIT
jgi:hypothetical protein